ncbi:restriction endonuclease [Pseudomonas graminis]|uniref:Restriction system protein n=1 Tax=Pseudomonas graminis TaxID=158627 RepID=A0A1I0J481_9PSED|nr:restriction endonuclease [Pseudomonas graminis]SEU04606.1 restriction system protein [Pseudomonas graminis]
MDMAKKTSNLEALIFLASKLPWWISAVLAVASAMWLHSMAIAPLPTNLDPRHFDKMVSASAFRGMATFGQFFVPLILVAGAIASIIGRRKRRNLLESAATTKGNPLLSITWHEFELLVGEALRRRGYSVRETGKNGPDGGIDLIARKDGETYVVQCKQWRSVQVGVPVVRELYGAMAAEGAVGGFVVTSGTFTKPARDFAEGRNVQLVDGTVLKQWIAEAKKPGPRPTVEIVPERVEPAIVEPEVVVTPSPASAPIPVQAPTSTATLTVVREAEPEPAAPLCPHCRKTMVIRVARTGANAGGNFWGCVAYPKCRGIRGIFAPMTVK